MIRQTPGFQFQRWCCGEEDSFLEHHVARAALEVCDQGALSIIAGATHWLHLEEPAQVNALISQFLNGNQ